ncbi:MAG: hypothetical protein K5779_04180 [Saccharofermentans sp.]|nr:hypothetical protein [Saccharofermentans sp.]
MMSRRKNKKGQITLEAAVAFTITLVFLASVISSIDLYRTDILMRRSCEQTCEKMSLLYPVSIPSTDFMSAALNAFPDLGIGGTRGAEVISKVISVGLGTDNATGNTVKELILQGLFSHTMEEQIRNACIERNGGSEFFVPDDIDVFFAVNEKHHIIEVTTEYSVVTIAGRKTRSIYSVIPLYGDPVLTLKAQALAESGNEEKQKDAIWSLSNFDRGDAFREKYGANLPKTFPVIDSVNGGEITAIRSIDLTSPYYQDISHVEKEIKEDIRAIKGFEPQSAVINGKTYSVDRVDSRHISVIIPENSSPVSKEALEELKGYAFVQGVILDISEYGSSDRYT